MRGHQYPHKIGIMVLVESDEAKQYREGSQDAAPVAASIMEWMESGNLRDSSETTAPASASIEE